MITIYKIPSGYYSYNVPVVSVSNQNDDRFHNHKRSFQIAVMSGRYIAQADNLILYIDRCYAAAMHLAGKHGH